MEAPDFWDDAEVSQQKMKELKSMKDDMETYHNLETQYGRYGNHDRDGL